MFWWFHEGYLCASFDDMVLTRVRQIDVALLLAILEVPCNDPWICERLQSWRDKFPALVDALAFNRGEIKCMWEINRANAAACGTYMHYMFEATSTDIEYHGLAQPGSRDVADILTGHGRAFSN